jgi:hypothetical protein
MRSLDTTNDVMDECVDVLRIPLFSSPFLLSHCGLYFFIQLFYLIDLNELTNNDGVRKINIIIVIIIITLFRYYYYYYFY